jgi:DUF1680 family protein
MTHCTWIRPGVWSALLALGWLVTTATTQAQPIVTPRDKVAPVIPLAARPFEVNEVRLLDGPFRHAQELDRAYVLSLDVDRLLHTFRLNAGLPSSAEPLGGWEEPKCELRGHCGGHYLSACALMYAATGDERFKSKGDAMVAGLAACQKAIGSGYLSAFPESFIDRVESGTRVWAPYYTLHKILAGLLDMYIYCDNAQALEVARKFGDWVVARNAKLTDDGVQKMLRTEHGGINEAMANLFAETGDEKYLKTALLLNHQFVIRPFSEGTDNLDGLHANTQIPKFIGAAREYELTADPKLKAAATFFWNMVVKERSYAIGGHSNGEMFSPKARLSRALGPNTTETCNTYNMLKLTEHLFCWDPQVEYADYYERAVINHILASQNPETGMMCYYVPLKSGMTRGGAGNGYCTPLDSFWCCTGTGIENHAKYGQAAYFRGADDKSLYVTLFLASELNWADKGLTVRQETGFPDSEKVKVHVTSKSPVKLAIKLRHPSWCTGEFRADVDGQAVENQTRPGSWLSIERTWEGHQVITLNLPFALRTEAFRDDPNKLAILDGPLVLCAQIDPKKPAPVIVPENAQWLDRLAPGRVPDRASTFHAPAGLFRIPGESDPVAITLEPFHKVQGKRPYAVYWDVLTAEQFREKGEALAVLAVRRREIDSRAVDLVNPGEEQNERDHKVGGERTDAGELSNHHWRHATDGGNFHYELKVEPDRDQELVVTYWGSDAGSRTFDILVDGQKLATERLRNRHPGEFFDQTYRLTKAATAGKDRLTVTFQAHPGNFAGGVFGIRVLRPKP